MTVSGLRLTLMCFSHITHTHTCSKHQLGSECKIHMKTTECLWAQVPLPHNVSAVQIWIQRRRWRGKSHKVLRLRTGDEAQKTVFLPKALWPNSHPIQSNGTAFRDVLQVSTDGICSPAVLSLAVSQIWSCCWIHLTTSYHHHHHFSTTITIPSSSSSSSSGIQTSHLSTSDRHPGHITFTPAFPKTHKSFSFQYHSLTAVPHSCVDFHIYILKNASLQDGANTLKQHQTCTKPLLWRLKRATLKWNNKEMCVFQPSEK